MSEHQSIIKEALRLRQDISRWAKKPEWSLMVGYELLPRKLPANLRHNLVWRIGRLSRVLSLSRSRYVRRLWDCGMKHGGGSYALKPLVIWAEGDTPEQVQTACSAFKGLLVESGLVPVLVTDVADFAFYSRLGWLVEYLPAIGGDNLSYRERKKRYLAWRYRDAILVPLGAAFATQDEWCELLKVSK